MQKEPSFSQRLKAGWSKKQLQKYYCLSDERYNKVINSLERIKSEVNE